MTDRVLFRLLEVVRQSVPALDARVEIGGEPPSGDDAVWADLHPGWRVVAILAADTDRDDARERLLALTEAFSGVPKRDAMPALRSVPQRALDAALAALCERTGAICALLIDATSPVLWGRSHDHIDSDLTVDSLVEASEHIGDEGLNATGRTLLGTDDDETAHLLASAALAVASVREGVRRPTKQSPAKKAGQPQSTHELPRRFINNDDVSGFDARLMADIYYAVLCFERRFSELSADGELTRATPMLERLIAALPPVEPPPRGARIIPLSERR